MINLGKDLKAVRVKTMRTFGQRVLVWGKCSSLRQKHGHVDMLGGPIKGGS